MTTIDTFKDIRAWEKSIELAKLIYQCSGKYPFARNKPLQGQIRKAVISIASNIAEGFEREGTKEFIQFLSANAITGEDWKKIKKEDYDKAEQLRWTEV